MKVHEKGFSLLELLVVVAIIGLLVGMAIPLLLDALDRSKQRANIADMRSWGTALSAYYSEKSIFPGVGGPGNASTIHGDLVPYAVSGLHDNNAWKYPFQYDTDVVSSYTFQDPGKDGVTTPLGACPAGCVTPQTWQDYDSDSALIDGVFVWAPS
jgi:prepilin-type N-terminal cleavage/methylation domain-containing protein